MSHSSVLRDWSYYCNFDNIIILVGLSSTGRFILYDDHDDHDDDDYDHDDDQTTCWSQQHRQVHTL